MSGAAVIRRTVIGRMVIWRMVIRRNGHPAQ
jgi:hypothetical protein